MKRILYLFVVLSVVLWFTVSGNDQAQSTSISGTVTYSDGSDLPGVSVTLTGSKLTRNMTTVTNEHGIYRFLSVPPGNDYQLRFELEGFKTRIHKKIIVKHGEHVKIDVVLELVKMPQEIIVTGKAPVLNRTRVSSSTSFSTNQMPSSSKRSTNKTTRTTQTVTTTHTTQTTTKRTQPTKPTTPNSSSSPYNSEAYSPMYDNQYKQTVREPLSTFSIDVDTASYTNIRRFLKYNQMPAKDAVRIEEMVNYFNYDYPQPRGSAPFSIVSEISRCPWNPSRRLVHIGLQGKKMDRESHPANNLVFLLDVSGSMSDSNKLPLLKRAFNLLVKQLDDRDKVAIVVYAGSAGVVLPSTRGCRKDEITAAIDRLRAGGSTAGGEGIQLAYRIAADNYIKNGNNRIILATDGDFNVGISSTSGLVRLIEEKRKKGIFLTVLGFGMGNYKDTRMEQLADKGNGNYHYIDGILEAKKVFVDQLPGTLFTIAKDVKIQVEFNPARVKAYRLIGYVSRLLNEEDFDDDQKDAGELGAGHTVTALYEIIPAHSAESVPGSSKLRYQLTRLKPEAEKSGEIMTVKLRYKDPKGKRSKLIVKTVLDSKDHLSETTDSFRFSAAVAQFGLLLRDSQFKGSASFDDVLKLAREAKGKDHYGYRAEFIKLVETCQLLHPTQRRADLRH